MIMTPCEPGFIITRQNTENVQHTELFLYDRETLGKGKLIQSLFSPKNNGLPWAKTLSSVTASVAIQG